jgi:hypothetical protein
MFGGKRINRKEQIVASNPGSPQTRQLVNGLARLESTATAPEHSILEQLLTEALTAAADPPPVSHVSQAPLQLVAQPRTRVRHNLD